MSAAKQKLERDLARSAVAERAPRVYRLCPYCATPCRGLTCAAHRDLPALDPNYGRAPAPTQKEATDG